MNYKNRNALSLLGLGGSEPWYGDLDNDVEILPAPPQKKPGNFASILDSISNFVGEGAGVITAIKNPSGSNVPVTYAAPGQPPIPLEKKNNTVRNIVLGVLGVAAVGGTIYYFKKKKKSSKK